MMHIIKLRINSAIDHKKIEKKLEIQKNKSYIFFYYVEYNWYQAMFFMHV